MTKTKVLIVVKTYPTLSKTYAELVCTAGFLQDGTWIRIYPAPFRFLNDSQRYRKYQWIELDLEKNPKDKRPESYRPTNIDDVTLGDFIDSSRDWEERRKLVLKPNKIHTNLEEIITAAKSNEYSLVVFKPTEILDFYAEKIESDWALDKKEAAQAALDQGSLFDEQKNDDFKLMPKLPWRFKYRFKDDVGKESNLMIEDWEAGQLYWNCIKRGDTPEIAILKVRSKYFDEFAKKKDLHFFLGTTHEWHQRAKNPYVIIGTFYPPKITQLSLL